MRGSIFDIEEFAVYDGPGIRSVVFLKGCPLRCNWCHNPEGLRVGAQSIKTASLCAHCGACNAVCPSPEACSGCGACAAVCPRGCIRVIGKPADAEEVAARVKPHSGLLSENGGGVTFSGGEPLLQPDFVLAIRAALSGLHACVETSGYADEATFARVVSAMDMVIMDVKCVDPVIHKQYTGVDNAPILKNLRRLIVLGVPFRVRVPLIPTVNDTPQNMEATAALLEGAGALEKVELLRYNRAAGAKYESAGLVFQPKYPEGAESRVYTNPFISRGIEVNIL